MDSLIVCPRDARKHRQRSRLFVRTPRVLADSLRSRLASVRVERTDRTRLPPNLAFPVAPLTPNRATGPPVRSRAASLSLVRQSRLVPTVSLVETTPVVADAERLASLAHLLLQKRRFAYLGFG